MSLDITFFNWLIIEVHWFYQIYQSCLLPKWPLIIDYCTALLLHYCVCARLVNQSKKCLFKKNNNHYLYVISKYDKNNKENTVIYPTIGITNLRWARWLPIFNIIQLHTLLIWQMLLLSVVMILVQNKLHIKVITSTQGGRIGFNNPLHTAPLIPVLWH